MFKGKTGALKKAENIFSRLWAILLMLVLGILGPLGVVCAQAQDSAPYYNLSMHVIDVGQGLSLLFESGGRYLLYDGGDRDYSSKLVSYLKQQNVQTLDYVIASHYDSDHLNGIVGALNVFEVKTVIAPDYTADTRVYQSFIDILSEKQIEITAPVAGTVYELGNSSFTILAPSGTEYADENDYSVAVRLDCKNNSYLVTGDATAVSEEEMLAGGLNLDADVLVVGHHGSDGSTSQEFLDHVSPGAAVISCETNNEYGHPSEEVMARLKEKGIPVFRTDLQGDLVSSSDGETIAYSANPCNDYTGGSAATEVPEQETSVKYILNTNTGKFHYPSCGSVKKIAPHNYKESNEARDALIAQGYVPCKNCNP